MAGMKIGKSVYKVGEYKKIVDDEVIKDLAEDEKVIITHWMKQEVEYPTEDDFTIELAETKKRWANQGVFYAIEAWKKNKDVKDDVRLFSARPKDDGKALYAWATKNKIPVSGKNLGALKGGGDTDAPLKGHFGDKAHTLKHWKQKSSSGSVCLITIVLNKDGVSALKGVSKVEKKGGEGYDSENFGLKQESEFVSVAITNSSGVWNKLKKWIARVEFEA